MGKKVLALTISCFMFLSFMLGINSYAEDGVEESINEDEHYIESILLNESNIELLVGKEYMLWQLVSDENYKGVENVKWVSESEDVATVNSEGRVTALSEGEAVIKVIAEDNINYGYCKVKVVSESNNVFIDTIRLEEESLDMEVGNQHILELTIEPVDATNKEVLWVSDNKDVVNVDSLGNIIAINEGKAIINIISADGGKTIQCMVNVKNPYINEESEDLDNIIKDEAAIEVEKDQIEDVIGNDIEDIVNVERVFIDRNIVEIKVGEDIKLNAYVLPETATNKNINWKSDNENVASVDGEGKVVGKFSGKANINAISDDGDKVAICEVNVIEEIIYVSKINIENTNLTIEVGENIKVTPSLEPQNATNKNIIWQSSDNNIVTANNYGVLEAKKNGTAVITIKSEDGNAYTYLAIEVKENSDSKNKIEEIALNKSSHTMAVGEVVNLEATIMPNIAKDEKILWKSSDEDIAKVDSNGKVVALKLGEANITASSEDGNITAQCKVKVTSKSNKENSLEDQNDSENDKNKLPQTGDNNYLGLAGCFLLGVGTLFISKK